MAPEATPEHIDLAALRQRFEDASQGHVFAHWDGLSEVQRASLAAELASVDLGLVARLGTLVEAGSAASSPALEPPDTFPLQRSADHRDKAEAAHARGAELLAAGKVGFVLVAGGQGSRLGFDGPKGAYEIGPATSKSLFEWHAARIVAAAARHGFDPTWYVMTSSANDATTRAYFEEHAYFGMSKDAVIFFTQDMLPALDLEGRIMMASQDALFLAPNGHGGTLAALHSSGSLQHARERGIEQLSYFQVDNPLARPADTLFLGLHDLDGAQMSSKVVAKRDSAEKVGVIGRIDGRLGCIEYSDLSDELREATDDAGNLVFNAGNIAAHVLRLDFVEALNEGGNLSLPWHVARKDIRTIDVSGAPHKVAGVKFETFVFDALAEASSSVTLEVDRAEEFSPVKNADGSDSPATCREDLSRIGRALSGTDSGTCEVDPRAAETADEFRARQESIASTRAASGVVFTPKG